MGIKGQDLKGVGLNNFDEIVYQYVLIAIVF